MKLLTKQLETRFAKIGPQSERKDPVVIAKFFNPTGAGTWYATEYDPKSRNLFGYVSMVGDWNDEWGSFSLKCNYIIRVLSLDYSLPTGNAISPISKKIELNDSIACHPFL